MNGVAIIGVQLQYLTIDTVQSKRLKTNTKYYNVHCTQNISHHLFRRLILQLLVVVVPLSKLLPLPSTPLKPLLIQYVVK